MSVQRFSTFVATIVLATSALTACGDDDVTSNDSSPPAAPDDGVTEPSTTTTEPSTTTTEPPATEPPTTTTEPPPTEPTTPGDNGGIVSEEDLAEAERVVVDFLDALGAGDVDAAAVLVGPVSEQNAGGADSLASLLQVSTEGHGAWATATDRVVTPIGVARGLVAVSLEGTLQVEGATEHRVEVFPVREAESADTWFVEPWPHDLEADPLQIVSPAVDDQEQASVDGDDVTVETTATESGTVIVAFDGETTQQSVDAGETVTFTAEGTISEVVAFLDAGSTLDAKGFVVSTESP